MKIEEKLTCRLTPSDIESLIINHLESEGYIVESVRLNVDQRSEGYFMNTYDVHYFSGAICEVKKNEKRKND